MSKNTQKRLGRGFDSLFPKIDATIINNNKIIQEIPLSAIQNNSEQPRKDFPLKELAELAQSIQNKGVLQPIILRLKSKDKYEIVAGERRWRASKIAGLKKIKAIVYDIPVNELREIALIENIQRIDLNPIETAIAYHSLLEKNSLTQETLAKKLGKNRASIAGYLRLLSLPQEITNDIINKKISVGHAKCLLSLPNSKEQKYFAQLIINKKLSVRELEKAIKKVNLTSKLAIKAKPKLLDDNSLKQSQELLSDFLQTNIAIQEGSKKGVIAIQFYNKDDLQRIVKKITN